MVTILHTNDFHHRLNEAQADRLRQLRESVEGRGLLVDAGDAVGSGNVTFRAGGEPIHDLMNHAKYDVGVVGNREFHFSRIGFHTKLSRADFPVLCANIRSVGDNALPVVPHCVFTVSGVKILFVGLTVPMITERMLSRKVSSFVFAEPIKTAMHIVPRLREETQADVVIALTHIGLKQDRLLAERVLGIDLIIGGHSHDILPDGERIGSCLVVQTGSYAQNVGKVEITRAGAQFEMKASLEAL